MAWLRACAEGDVEPGEAAVVQIDGEPVAVFNVDGAWYATADTCSHDKSSLADGYIEGEVVECAWHFAKFCLRSGAVLAPPATVAIRAYATKIEAGAVYVDS